MFISGRTGNETRLTHSEHAEKAPFVQNRSNGNDPVLSLCQIHELLRGRLQAHTMPSCIEQLPFIPMMVDKKAAS